MYAMGKRSETDQQITMDRADYAHWNSADVARLLALVESERRYYQDIVAGIPVGLLVVTSDLRVASANAAVRRIFGLQSADPVRGSLDLLLPGTILDKVAEVLRTACAVRDLRVTSRTELGGRELRVAIRPMTGWDLDSPREALITIEDLTGIQTGAPDVEEQSAAGAPITVAGEPIQEAPAEAAEPEDVEFPLERALIRDADAAIWACELPAMRFVFVSEGAARTTGFGPAYWIDSTDFWRERIDAADRDRVEAEYREALAREGHFSGEFRAVTADGRTAWVHESARVVDAGEGRRYLIGITVDVSDRRAEESEMLQSQRLDALKALSARLSHDLNNLLMIVVGYSEDALNAVDQSSTAHTSLNAIRSAGERLSAIAGQLRTFATFSPGEPAPIDLNELLRRVQASMAETRVALQPAAEPVWVIGEAADLEQAVRAAVNRALATTPESGEISVAVIAESVQPGFAGIEVRDTAPAVGAAEHNGIFEQLLGGKQPGDDFGGPLARAFLSVRQWGGSIRVHSAEGGNVLRILLRATEAPAPPVVEVEEPVAAPEPEVRGPQTILVVEDEGGIRALVRKILERHGYAVLDAPGAEPALQTVENTKIDLIITDITMPDMSGQELVEKLRQLRPDARVLFISGYTEDSGMYTRDLGPGTAFLQKPFTLGALVGKVREVLGGEA